MKDWNAALDKFIGPWRKRRDVVGALVAGSYVTGKPNPRSDLDVYIVTKAGTKWRERGNRRVDGFLIEYFVNPPAQIRAYFADNYAHNSAMSLTPYTNGRILFDDGTLAKLRREAQHWLRKPLQRPSAREQKVDAYRLWDARDNVEDAFERGAADIPFVYHHALQRLFEAYTRSLGQIVPGVAKTYGLLTISSERSKYNHPPHPDQVFAKQFSRAICECDPKLMVKRLRALTKHVHERWGGFEIDGFRLRTPVEPQAKSRKA